MTRFIKLYGLALIWAIIILKLSTMSLVPLSKFSWSKIGGIDKVAHFGFYFILTCFLFYGLSHDLKPKNWTLSFISKGLLPPIIFGFLIELLQSTIDGRYFEFADFIANTLGCFIALWMVKYLKTRKLWIYHGQEQPY